ncbi:gamma-soluble NSF attachment protein, partial [Haematococcus lacustris]
MADKQEEAGKLMKKASKAISPSLFDFRLKPDWEVAAPLFERAAVLFKMPGMQQVGRFEDASEAYERASTAQEKLQSPFHAAKHMEAAAETARLSKSWDKVFEYTKSAAELYINANRATVAADCLARGARQLEEHDVEHALTLLYDAVDIYESDTKEANAADVFRQAISLLVRAKRYPEAVEMMMRF